MSQFCNSILEVVDKCAHSGINYAKLKRLAGGFPHNTLDTAFVNDNKKRLRRRRFLLFEQLDLLDLVREVYS